MLLERWPSAEVHLFGSTANCLSICNNNDIDVCLELSEAVQGQVRPTCSLFQLHIPKKIIYYIRIWSMIMLTVTLQMHVRMLWQPAGFATSYCLWAVMQCMPKLAGMLNMLAGTILLHRLVLLHHVLWAAEAKEHNLAGQCKPHLTDKLEKELML